MTRRGNPNRSSVEHSGLSPETMAGASPGAPAPPEGAAWLQPLPTLWSLERAYRAIVFTWEGAGAARPQEAADDLARLLDDLQGLGVWLVVVAEAGFRTLERQAGRALPRRRQRLLVCSAGGCEVYAFDRRGAPVRRWQRAATPAERVALAAAVEALAQEVTRRAGAEVRVLVDGPSRRRLDLLPLPAWTDPSRERLGELLDAVEDRLRHGGLAGGLAEVVALAEQLARQHGLAEARVGSDLKHVRLALADAGDALEWVRRAVLEPAGIPCASLLVVGDAFGPMAGLAGSDDRLRAALPGAVCVSVGAEPGGVPEQVVHLGGGPPQLWSVLKEQVRLHHHLATGGDKRRGEPAEADDRRLERALEPPADPHWRLVARGYRPAVEREVETRLAIANGALGVRGSLDRPAPGSRPRTYVAGVFATPSSDSSIPRLVSAPNWLPIQIEPDSAGAANGSETAAHTRVLDLRRGVLLTEWLRRGADGVVAKVRTLRFVSLADRSLAVQVARLESDQPAPLRVQAGLVASPDGLVRVDDGDGAVWRARNGRRWVAMATHGRLETNSGSLEARQDGANGAHTWRWRAAPGEPATLVRLVALARGETEQAARATAWAALRRARRLGPRRLLEAHVRAWAERWAASDVTLDGDEAAQRALRFAIYHLLSAANPQDEHVSVGARALTGDGYLGHVFWDTEIFLLPFYTFTWPQAARAMLMYRYHTLPGARAKAERLGYRGALYAWESTDTGDEATPPYVLGADGRVIPILCGVQEQHISADVAYAVWQYWQATADDAFLLDAGAEILLETARFWASRATLEADGRYHIRGVIGPDEYHEGVDDNAYTNGMARWNLERGLEVAELLRQRWPDRWRALAERLALAEPELARWADVASRLVTGFDPASGLFEQFAGYFGLEEVDLSRPEYASRTVPMDVLLGPERTRRSKVIKQADVVMLLALLPEQFDRRVHEVNFRYYAERCGHGSSLSPAVHALQAARLGNVALAERYFRQTAAIDLEDGMGNTAQGVHIAAQGGLWQVAVLGFAGMSLRPDGLAFQPRLPSGWKRLALAVQWRGRTLRVELDGERCLLTATLEGPEPLVVHVDGLDQPLEPEASFTCQYASPAEG